ncbi:MAG: PAS domain-containing protein, partial [Desulforhopalus sp.]
MSSEQIKVGNSDLEQADHLRRIFEAIPEGVICADREERSIILVNPVAEKMFGYREKELIGLRIDCLYSSREDCEQVGREWLSSEWEPSAKPFETTLKKKDGSIFPAEIQAIPVKGGSGEIICFLKLIRDISERKQLEDSLRSMEVKFRTVADFTYDWECWLQPNGRFRYVSPSCRRLTGRPVEEFMDNPSLFRDIIHPEDKPVWDEHYRDARARAGLREVQFRIVRTDGEVRWIEHACQPVIDEYGTLQGFRSSNRDITRRKEYENELSQALAEIESYKDQLQAETEYLRQEMNVRLNYDSIVGSSNALQYIFFKIEQISTS